ncbi:MAG: energy-coupled thiamine transporter ThiT [Ruminococcaceae bacterium]|nr:energy-coupled thiamine transporter ThiT [Oscillospiraceae bacterium]
MEKSYSKTRIMVECAIMIAVATVLSTFLKVYEAPLGGSVTVASMAPIIILSYRHGVKWGVESALIYSLIQLILGLGSVAWVPTVGGILLCVLFDYVIAFTLVGFAGIFKKLIPNEYVGITVGTFVACLMRFLCHLVSGAVVWYEITKAGQWNDVVNQFGMWAYSLIYNAQYMVPETIITVIVTPLVFAMISKIEKRR